MAKNPNGKKTRRKELAEKVALRTEAKRAERNASSNGNGSSQNRGKGLAIPAKKMEQMSNDTLRTIVANNQPGAHLAKQVLDKRAEQAAQQRAHNQQTGDSQAATA
jgi:hypothetical protein